MNTPRILVVEDDDSIRRFIAMAFEGMAVELREAATVASAIEQLREGGPFGLMLLDMMLPDGHGERVLEELRGTPSLRQGMRVAVFSAGLHGTEAQRLRALGADEVIGKPAPLARLLTALDSALSTAPTREATDAAVATYFNGDRPLFERYRRDCLAQFAHDRRSGHQLLARADWAGLRRLAHSLKTVLQTLGEARDGDTARQLEQDAAAGHEPACRLGWSRLAAALDRLAAAAEGP